MPPKDISADAVAAALETAGQHDLPWRDGGTFDYIHDAGPKVEAVTKHAYMRYPTENDIDPTIYPSLLGFET